MSHNAVELCTLLVEDLLGDLAATIFRTLAVRGRLPFDLLGTHTQIHPRRLRAGLTALIQQNFVLWSPSDRDRGPVHYEACLERAERIGQYGRYVTVVEERYGKTAGRIVRELLLHGILRVCDVVNEIVEDTQDYEAGKQKAAIPNGAVVNGAHAAESLLAEKEMAVNKAMQTLREDEIIVPFLESYRRPLADNQALAEDMVAKKAAREGASKSKNKALLRIEVLRLLQRWRRGIADHIDEPVETSRVAVKKRKARSEDLPSQPPSKKLKADAVNGLMNSSDPLSNHGSNSTKGSSRDVTCIRINFDKLALLLRNDTLVQHAEKTLGHATAQVYAALVHLVVPKLYACRSILVNDIDLVDLEQPYNDDPHVELREIADFLEDTQDFMDSIAPPPDSVHPVHPATSARQYQKRPKPKTGKKKKNEFSSDDEDLDNDMNDADSGGPDGQVHSHSRNGLPDRSPLGMIRQHLFLLATHTTPFLTYLAPTSGTNERWSVPFPELTNALRLDLICNTIHTVHDDLPPQKPVSEDADGGAESGDRPSRDSPYVDTAGLRIARILSEVGKLDEKALTARSLLPSKLLRARCAALHAAGLLELQEVPRDAQRLPARTLFLWYLDPGRAGRRVAENARASMVRLLQRRKMEAERRRGMLEKANRSDVKGSEQELLSAAELDALQRWKAAEARIWGGVARLGEAVALVNEY